MARSSQFPPSVDPGVPQEWPTAPGWRRASFRELVEIVERRIDLVDSAEYQLVNAKRSRGGIVARTRMLGKDIRVKNQYRVEAGDFLLSCRQIIHGACGVVPADLAGAVVSNEYVVFRPRSGLRTEYLQQLSHTRYFQRACFHSSVGVDVEKMVFKIEKWLDYHISIPPMAEQARIVEILAAVDDAIAHCETVAARLENVRRDVAANLLRTSPTGKRLGPIPSAWRESNIGAECDATSGGTPSRAMPEYWGGDVPWVKTGEINYADIVSTEESITPAGLANSAAKVIRRGAVVMAMYGQGATRGRCAVLSVDAALNQACLALTPSHGLNSRFLFHYLSHLYPAIRALGHEGTQKNLNARLVRSIPLLVPPPVEQQAIAEALAAVGNRIEKERAVLAERRRVKTALVDELLSGRLRVRDAA